MLQLVYNLQPKMLKSIRKNKLKCKYGILYIFILFLGRAISV